MLKTKGITIYIFRVSLCDQNSYFELIKFLKFEKTQDRSLHLVSTQFVFSPVKLKIVRTRI